MMTSVLDFHFLRPWWLFGVLPLGVMLFLLVRQRVGSKGWEAVCDAHLLPHLLVGNDRVQSRGPYILLAVVWSLCLLALAGPVWSKLPQPVYRAQSALVLVLDLSRSMDAEDLQSSRLTRAKHKVLDILKRRQEGQTALVVFSGEPYVVSPLTEDANTIAAIVSSLDTSLMPVQGSRQDLALLRADQLLEQSDVQRGNLLLITDGIDESPLHTVVKRLTSKHHRVSVLGVGTTDGAPIPQSGGFLKDEDGAIVIPKLDPLALAELATMGQGRYATLTVDDQDLETVLPSEGVVSEKQQGDSSPRTTELWREEGPWIVLGIVALTIPAFRAGWLGVLFLTLVMTPTSGQAFFGENWWFRPDQQGARAMNRDDPQTAASLFENPSWKGVANYRAGNFQEAVENFSHDDSPDGHFNRGNALARAGQLQEALQAYQTALQQAPTHEDARHNYELVEKLLQKQDNQRHSESQENSSHDEHSSKPEQSEGEQGSQGQRSQEHQDPQRRNGQQRDSQAGPQSNASSQPANGESSQEAERQNPQSMSGASEDQPEPKSVLAQQEMADRDHGEDDKEASRAGRVPDPPELQSQDANQKPMTTAGLSREEKTQLESQQALKQWLRRIPDDPGGLLRRKFLLEHRRRQEAGQLNNAGGKTW